jgi:hypothetical protein
MILRDFGFDLFQSPQDQHRQDQSCQAQSNLAPAPIKPMPVKTPNGSRIKSSMMNEFGERPAVASSRFTWIIETDAARQTRIVVRSPAERPRSARLMPITAPAMTVKNSRQPMSYHSNVVGIPTSSCMFSRHTGVASTIVKTSQGGFCLEAARHVASSPKVTASHSGR